MWQSIKLNVKCCGIFLSWYNERMVEIPVRVKLPFLWGRAVFKKSVWPHINLIVGPNGSGKTLLAEEISRQFCERGYSTKFLRSERDGDFEAFNILRENEIIRTKVQRVLSDMFGKSIVFRDKEDGRFVPVVQNRAWNVEYDLQEVECHGLKEIITLLVTLYANTGNTCIVFDEPELHLHPQFQQFFAEELRAVSKRHPKRIFFVITHSPFFIDLRFSEELTGVIVCHTNREPTHIDSLSKKDEELFRRFLPRFNTYHKQFFFSDNQIFVEGYTDQQMFTHLLPFVKTERGLAGTGIIDVGGKDELGVFCKVCQLLGTNGRIITDLDSLFSGKLRDVFCSDRRSFLWLQKQKEKQLPFLQTIFNVRDLEHTLTLEKLIVRLEKFLAETGRAICQMPMGAEEGSLSLDSSLIELREKLLFLDQKHENAENVDTFKTVVLQGVLLHAEKLYPIMPKKLGEKFTAVKNLFSIILAGAAAASVYILPKGCIEHYYVTSNVHYMPVSAKDKLFHSELEHLLSSPEEKVRAEYADLIGILESAMS